MVASILFSALLLSPPKRDCAHLPPPQAPRAEPNDNTIPAGTLDGARLTLHLVAQTVSWYPEGPEAAPFRSMHSPRRGSRLASPDR